MADSDYLFATQKGGTPISRVNAWSIVNENAETCWVLGPIGYENIANTCGITSIN